MYAPCPASESDFFFEGGVAIRKFPSGFLAIPNETIGEKEMHV